MKKNLFCFLGLLSGFVVMGQINVDTIYVNESGVTLIFPAEVGSAVVNLVNDYSVSPKGKQVIVRAKKETKRLSPMSVEYGVEELFFTVVKYAAEPKKMFYDFRKVEAKKSSEDIEKENQVLELARQKDLVRKKMDDMLFEKKEIQTIGGIMGNITFKLSNIKIDDEYIYLRFNLKNSSRMDFNLDYVRFQGLERVKNSDSDSDKNSSKDEDIVPFVSSSIVSIRKESSEYLMYALPIYGISEKGGYKVTLKERNGNRAIRLVIKAKDIDKAEKFK